MKKLLLLLLLSQISFAQINTGTTKSGKYQMNIPDLGVKKDSLVVWDGNSKLLKYVPISSISSVTNLDYLAAPTGGTVFSSSGNDATVPLATKLNSGLFSPAEKAKLESFTETPDATVSAKGKLKLTGDLGGTSDLPTTPTALHKSGDETKNGKLTVNVTGFSAFKASSTSDVAISGTVGSSSTSAVFSSTYSSGSTASLYEGRNSSNTLLFKVGNLGDVTGNSFIKAGGNAWQFLKADGSIDSNTYISSSAAASAISALGLDSGRYSPTVTGLVNALGTFVLDPRYTKIGNIVTVQLGFGTTTSASGTVIFEITLPTSKAGTSGTYCGSGTASASVSGNSVYAPVIVTGASTTKARIYFNAINAGTTNGAITFIYDASN